VAGGHLVDELSRVLTDFQHVSAPSRSLSPLWSGNYDQNSPSLVFRRQAINLIDRTLAPSTLSPKLRPT
jgi:hypothetical protein